MKKVITLQFLSQPHTPLPAGILNKMSTCLLLKIMKAEVSNAFSIETLYNLFYVLCFMYPKKNFFSLGKIDQKQNFPISHSFLASINFVPIYFLCQYKKCSRIIEQHCCINCFSVYSNPGRIEFEIRIDFELRIDNYRK